MRSILKEHDATKESPQVPNTILKALLFCGILSSLLFIGIDIIAANQWEGYSYRDQAFSELTAVEAPTRQLMIFGISIPYNLLMMAFSLGVWATAAGKRAQRIMAVMLLVHAVSGFVGSFIFPMHSRGAEKTMAFTDIMHIVFTSVEVLSMLFAIGFGAASFGKRFRFYSIGTILILLAGGTLAALEADQVAAGLPTPWMGVTERINIYAFMLWVIVLAIVLLQKLLLPNRRHLLNTFRFFALLSIFFIGCNQAADNTKLNHSGVSDCNSLVSEDTTGAASYQTGRGALLGTRFPSFEALKSVIQIEYENGTISSDSTVPENRFVIVRHCSNGREVISVLEKGTSQGDILKARYQGAIWDRLSLVFCCPYAVMNRKVLERIFLLTRRQPEWFGEGDLAFFDIAKSSVENINTPDLAIRNSRDTTEKGYLNSFNHITAQAFTTSCISEEMADFIADSHERYRHPELITGKFTATQIADLEEGPVDNYVDIINNEWGQELGKKLKEKYGINRETNWTPELLANYLNDLQSYYSWAFQIGFEPYRPEEEQVLRFSNKINELMKDRVKFIK